MKHPLFPKANELGLPIVSGILLAISFPPLHLFFPPFIALVPYLLFVASRPTDEAGSRSAARATFWMGVVYYGVVLYWLFTALVFYTWLALLGYLITVIVLSLFLAGAGYAIHRLRSRRAFPFWASLPIFWVAIEWLRAHLGDLAFPWLGLGHSLTGYPWVVGFADIAGARGVSVWLVAINGALAEWWLEGWRRRWPRWAAALALLVGLPLGYSLLRWNTLVTRPAAKVLVVQPNIPEDLKLQRELAADSSRTALQNLTLPAIAAEDDLDLIVWPETALPQFFEVDRQWTMWAAFLARRHQIPLLFGALDLERYPDSSFDYYNAAVYLDDSGSQAGLYQKRYLVPVVEQVPFIPLAWMRAIRLSSQDWRLPLVGNVGGFLQWFGGFARGEELSVMPLDDDGFGVLICYESIFPQLSRRFRREGADFLVNITNDSWFGRERPWWSQTSALYQHPSHLVMRAIENRMGIARAANTGISGFIDPRGRKSEMTDLFVPVARAAVVETTDGLTLYSRFGDWIGWLAAIAAATLFFGSAWQDRQRGKTEEAG